MACIQGHLTDVLLDSAKGSLLEFSWAMFQCLSNFAQKVKARHEKEKVGPFLSAIF